MPEPRQLGLGHMISCCAATAVTSNQRLDHVQADLQPANVDAQNDLSQRIASAASVPRYHAAVTTIRLDARVEERSVVGFHAGVGLIVFPAAFAFERRFGKAATSGATLSVTVEHRIGRVRS